MVVFSCLPSFPSYCGKRASPLLTPVLNMLASSVQMTILNSVMDKYHEEMSKLSERLLHLMMDSLGIPIDQLPWAWPTVTTTTNLAAHSTCQLNSYLPCPDPNRAMGMAPHTDSSLFTILQGTQPIAGLQVLKDGIGWVPVPQVSGVLVVNIGDLLLVLSNG
ncbi:hypothetical protein Scep_016412 [Stephania cephalantha]|uniref:Isopenicillin N synthase-like Fe(2+) 2OG dioxygenase domain-containing protein n=1 Tax=Stephania cephalantha TaxID=152367 RepID=A0AAP0IMK5_9MAGN